MKGNTKRTQEKKNPPERKIEITGIITFLFGFFMCLSLFGYRTGIAGDFFVDGFHVLFGASSLIIAVSFILIGVKYTFCGNGLELNRKVILSLFLFLIMLSGYHHFMTPLGAELRIEYIVKYGGFLGGVPVWGIRRLFGLTGTTLFLTGCFIIDIILLTHWSVSRGAKKIGDKTEEKIGSVKVKIQEKRASYRAALNKEGIHDVNAYQLKDFIFKKIQRNMTNENQILQDEETDGTINIERGSIGNDFPAKEIEENTEQSLEEQMIFEKNNGNKERIIVGDDSNEMISEHETKATTYQFPPLALLHESKEMGEKENDMDEKAVRLESTLKSFGVKAKVKDVSVGPTVTRYELEPAPGVRVSKIEGLSDDIALQLAATSIRIEAPIPGKSAVGIEISNAKPSSVSLREVLSNHLFQKGKGKILVALGKDIAGNTVVTDLTKMPHLLIAGQTGSGKSVCINTIITSILYHSCPEDVKMILIDPKVVELSVYNGIPHLRIEVVTDPKKAAGALNWAVTEMESRYKSFSEHNVRDITGFNKQNPEEKMPFIVVIIDELADLIMVAKDSVENSICRLAQKARAAGIHLVVATQRPSVDVITGLIKANIPSRISFAVSSQVDSRTILDKSGAEKLLGKGDMLFVPSGAPNPVRVQGAFVSDEEVSEVVNYIKTQSLCQEETFKYDPIELSLPEQSVPENEENFRDELLEEAAEWILDTKRVSVSALQRRFRIGYTRAGRLMDTMESMGIVGPSEGAKPRQLLISKERLSELFSHQSAEQ